MKAKRFILMLLVMLMSVTGAWAQMTFIKEIKISVGGESSSQKKLTDDGYTIVQGLTNTKSKDLNNGGGGEFVYLGYKTTTNPAEAITDIVIIQNTQGGVWDVRNVSYKTDGYNMFSSKYDAYIKYYRCDSYGDDNRDCDLNRGRDGSADITLFYTKYGNTLHGENLLTEIKIADDKNATGYQYTHLHRDGQGVKYDDLYGNTNEGGDSDDPPHYIVFKTHTHNVSATFNWSADGNTCTANISCGCGMSSNNVQCNVTTTDIQEPTCTTDGVKACTATVNRYGKDFSDTKNFVTGSRLGHEILTQHDRVEATCTQDGNYEYWTCSRACCEGVYYRDAEGTEPYDAYPVFNALGHDMTHYERVEATYSQIGNFEYWTCSRACCEGIYYKNTEGTESYSEYSVIQIYPKFEQDPLVDADGFTGIEDQTIDGRLINWGVKTEYTSHADCKKATADFRVMHSNVTNARLQWYKDPDHARPEWGNFNFKVYVNEEEVYSLKQNYNEVGGFYSVPLTELKTGDVVRFEVEKPSYASWAYNGNVIIAATLEYLFIPEVKLTANEDPDNEHKYYTTFYDSRYAYTLPQGVKAYTATIENNDGEQVVMLNNIEGNILPKGEAVLLYSGVSGEMTLTSTTEAADNVDGNAFRGVDENTTAPDFCYILSYGQNGLGFYRYAEGNALAAHKAYLIYEPGTAEARAFRMVFADDNEADGIQQIENGELEIENSAIYNLNGMRLDKLQKGINIVNGKKVIVK